MKSFYTWLFILLVFQSHSIQATAGSIKGRVFDKNAPNTPLVGVNIFWLGTTKGTISNLDGFFDLPQPSNSIYLVFSYVGYKSDTLTISDNSDLTVFLSQGTALDEVAVTERLQSTSISKINPLFVQNISNKELTKFACCNLSESFETNASVDVSFADAVSGIKQIKLLGLNGRYSQMMMENIPILRGAESAFGLEYIPGTWLQSIQVSKGSAAVKNGYESVTGQINVQYKEPDGLEKMSFYAYANQDGKLESNATYSIALNNKWSTSLLLHAGKNFRKMDENNDGFLDRPLANQLNIMNRWNYKSGNSTLKIGVSVVDELRQGGQNSFDFNQQASDQSSYGILIDVKRWNAFAKIGHIFNRPSTSLGWINAVNQFKRESFYGRQNYNAQQLSYYSNLIFQSFIGNTKHTFNTGLSITADKTDETLNTTELGFKETVPGVFLEYNYIPSPGFSLLAGIRYDYSSLFGGFYTPRLHAKYHFPAYTTLRASLGKGYRTASALNENTQFLASARQFQFDEQNLQEEAWNYGISMVNEIPLGKRTMNLTLEYFRTDFIKQLVVDLEQEPGVVHFYALQGLSYANNAQIELFYELFERFELTMALRWNDVKTNYKGTLKTVPMVNKYKGMLSAQYRTNMDKWQFDATLQMHGQSRLIPLNTAQNTRLNSDNYYNLLAQVTKNYRNWSFYVGAENLTNFVQKNAIIDAANPFGDSFDASQIWGPVYGRMFYLGIKYTIDKR